ncbi:MAG: flavin reductase [Methylococcaceae bacterium]|nr:flavin reductase [Methylococcaceae bacterium]
MAVNDQDFKNALKLWASGVAVVTAKTEKFGVQGMTVTSFSSVSLGPHQILVCLNKDADTVDGVFENQAFAVNILNAEQEQASNQFAGGSSQEERFANIAWTEGAATGSPVFDDALVSIECKVVEKMLSGTHWVIVGEVQAVECRSGNPLLYFNSGYRGLNAA